MTHSSLSLLAPLPPATPPSGWRLLPTGTAEVIAFRSPSGLTVSVTETAERDGVYRRVKVSRSVKWPSRLELEFVARQFLGDVAYEVETQHGLHDPAVCFSHRAQGGQGTPADAQKRLDQVATYTDSANARREQSSMRASMSRVQLPTPEGWRSRPSPLGPPVYDRNGFQVIVCDASRDGQRWLTLSVGRADRSPTLDEAREMASAFVGPAAHAAQPTGDHSDDPRRKVLVLECRLG